jgi:hypothetical protein
VWGSIGPFCFITQNDEIEPKATKSTLFFLFAFIQLLCVSQVARPCQPGHAQVAAGENVSYVQLTFVLVTLAGTSLTLVLHSLHPCKLLTTVKLPWLN